MAKRIMVVDDALFMRATIKRILEQGGYEIAGEAENGQDAVDKYPNSSPMRS